jgi:hypothetical protein
MRLFRLIMVATALTCASAPFVASAETIVVTETRMESPNIVQLNDGVVNLAVYEGPFNFTAVGFDPNIDLFCIEPHAAITVGTQLPPLVYTTTTLQAFLSSRLPMELEHLADFIRIGSVTPGPSQQQNALQGAVWNFLTPGSVTSSDPGHQMEIDSYAGWTGSTSLDRITVLQSEDGHQTFAYYTAAAAVPEPSSWAMMLVGFGAVGVSMRRKPSRWLQAV